MFTKKTNSVEQLKQRSSKAKSVFEATKIELININKSIVVKSHK